MLSQNDDADDGHEFSVVVMMMVMAMVMTMAMTIFCDLTHTITMTMTMTVTTMMLITMPMPNDDEDDNEDENAFLREMRPALKETNPVERNYQTKNTSPCKKQDPLSEKQTPF